MDENNPHITLGTGSQVGIITLWTKKEHVLKDIPKNLFVVMSQLYSRDEGLSLLVRNLFKNKNIRDLIVVGVDMNDCAETLLALWKEGVENGLVNGAPGFIDKEIPSEAIDRLRKEVEIHDLRKEKDYKKVAAYIKQLPKKSSWGEEETFHETRIIPPKTFPTAHQHALRHNNIKQSIIELAHLMRRFGTLYNVHLHLLKKGVLPPFFIQDEELYTHNLLTNKKETYGKYLHKEDRLKNFFEEIKEKETAVLTIPEKKIPIDLIQATKNDSIHLSCHISNTSFAELPLLAAALFSLADQVGEELDKHTGTITLSVGLMKPYPKTLIQAYAGHAHVLRKEGDPRSNILIRLQEKQIWVTHLSPEGKRLELFSGTNAKDMYKRLIVEHRITDLSHAAYLGYELAKAEEALKKGEGYEQDEA